MYTVSAKIIRPPDKKFCSFYILKLKTAGNLQLLLCRSSLSLVYLEIMLDRNFVLFLFLNKNNST